MIACRLPHNGAPPSGLDQPVSSSVFVDAALPARTGPTPVASPELLEFLRPMAVNGRLPRWTDWVDDHPYAYLLVGPQIVDPAGTARRLVEPAQVPQRGAAKSGGFRRAKPS
ncbi:hypothetical protein AB0C13_39255 [Streptomyces sp. NPDC049099]|uniref:hypothetical protein n=1 Tax=Streptomyces sp. NPDC049099 TaxID=3155768 RepID=UPI0034152987